MPLDDTQLLCVLLTDVNSARRSLERCVLPTFMNGASKEGTTDTTESQTSSSAMAERPRELGDFKGLDHFKAKF